MDRKRTEDLEDKLYKFVNRETVMVDQMKTVIDEKAQLQEEVKQLMEKTEELEQDKKYQQKSYKTLMDHFYKIQAQITDLEKTVFDAETRPARKQTVKKIHEVRLA